MNLKNRKVKQPWPTKKAMAQVYQQHLWGGRTFDFYSGDGSHVPEIVNPYLKVVISFLKSSESPLSVCDLGCGDFNIGEKLVPYTKVYNAIDIVNELIECNKEKFKHEHLQFHCLDISLDTWPASDCIILRQVLQHLSNAEVKNISNRLSNYKYVVLTEHIPEGDFIPNKDIISGQGTRLKQGSGINLLASPFNLKIKEAKELLVLPSNIKTGIIVTTLYTMY